MNPSAAALTARRRVWALTWLGYASLYLARKNWSVVKPRVRDALGLGLGDLAFIDTAYLLTYALGQFVAGLIGDRIGARRLMGLGALGVAVATACFGASSGLTFFALSFALNGLAQASGWPGATRAMAAATDPAHRGAVMGWWATCYQAGGIASTSLAAWLLGRYGWRSAFTVPAALIAVMGVALLVAMPDLDRGGANSTAGGAPPEGPEALRAARRAVLGNPLVWRYGAAYAAIKLIRYSLLFWMPFYLREGLRFDETVAGYLSNSFELGGVVGTIAFGALTDRVRVLSRAQWSALSLAALGLALVLYAQVSSLGVAANFAAMALVGALLFGPDTVLSGCAAQDLGGPLAAATAAGFVNGMGSLGAIAQGLFTVKLRAAYGWQGVFVGFVVLSLVGAGCLLVGPRNGPAPKT